MREIVPSEVAVLHGHKFVLGVAKRNERPAETGAMIEARRIRTGPSPRRLFRRVLGPRKPIMSEHDSRLVGGIFVPPRDPLCLSPVPPEVVVARTTPLGSLEAQFECALERAAGCTRNDRGSIEPHRQ